jgi:hypothetical protein
LGLILSFSALPALGAYNDISGHWAGSAITQLQGLGAIPEGSGAFYPDNPLTREVAADWIVRALKSPGEIAAQQVAADSLPAGLSGISPGYEGSVLLALSAGILTPGDVAAPFVQGATRQEAIVWLCRGFGILPDMTGQYNLNRFQDAAAIDPGTAPYIVSAVREGMLAGSGGFLRLQNPITRGEFASLLQRFYARYTLNSSAGTPVVYRSGKITGLAYPSLTVQNLDNSQSVLTVAGNSQLLKNGSPAALSSFLMGETVTYQADGGGRLVNLTSTVVVAAGLPANPWTTYRNTYLTSSGDWIEGEVRAVSESRGEIDLYTHDGGKRFYADPDRFEKKGSLYYFDQQMLRIGAEVRLYFTGTQIDSLTVLGSWNTADNVVSRDVIIYKGKIEDYNSSDEWLELKEVRRWNGSSWGSTGTRSYRLSSAAVYDFDGSSLSRRELASSPGDTVYVLYDNEAAEVLSVRRMKGTESSLSDKVVTLNRDSLKVGNITAFADYTTFVVAGSTLYDIEDVEENDRVRLLYISSGGDRYAILIELTSSGGSSNSTRGAYTVYQGDWDELSRDYLTLRSLKELDSGSWQSRNPKEFDLSGAACFYDGSRLSDYTDLSSYKNNHTFYVLADDSNRALQVVVARDTTFRSETGSVDEISGTAFSLERSSNEYSIETGTIMVEAGQEMSSRRLYTGQEVYVVYERDGSDYRALLIERLD